MIFILGYTIASPIGSSKRVAALPFVRAFFPFGSPCPEFLDGLWREHTINQLIKQQLAKKGTISRDLKDQQAQVKEDIDKAVGKQFRRVSIRVHPDRVGERFATKFEALTAAYQYLMDSTTRREYMEAMLLPSRSGGMWPCLAHDKWLQERNKAQERNTERARYQAMITQVRGGGGAKGLEPLLIEGAWRTKKPRQCLVRQVDGIKRNVELEWQPLNPVHAFQAYVSAVFIVIDGGETEIKIDRDELEVLYSESLCFYRKTVHFPDWGPFSVTWYARLLVDGKQTDTVQSDPVEINIVHPTYSRALSERPAWVEMARRQSRRLLYEIARHDDALHDRSELQQRQIALHRSVCNAQVIIRKLCQIMNDLDGDDSSPESLELEALRQTLLDASSVQSRFGEILAAMDKKDSRKSFAKRLKSMIEAGEAITWLSTVSKEGLLKLGVDANRLYQLLSEGKKASATFLDPSVLEAASLRRDLFSPKQCKVLSQRCSEAEAQRQAELEKELREQVAEMELGAETNEIKCTKPPEYSDNSPTGSVAGFKEESFVADTTPRAACVSVNLDRTFENTPADVAVTKSEDPRLRLMSPSPLTVALSAVDNCHGSCLTKKTADLLQFLRTESSCLKCAAEDFCAWLLTKDVDSLAVLSEAVNDDLFIEEMQSYGIKRFKCTTFQKNLVTAIATKSHPNDPDPTAVADAAAAAYRIALDEYLSRVKVPRETFLKVDLYAPEQLQCSISTVLMVVDPVVATDGYTYERHAIQNWMTTRLAKGEPVTSPRTNQVLHDLCLSPNISSRNMAREYLLAESQKTWS